MRVKFSQDAVLGAAAAIVAARLQAGTAIVSGKGDENVSQMLLQAMTEVLGGIELMEDQAKSESMDLWERLAE
jgi:hypothetical protein